MLYSEIFFPDCCENRKVYVIDIDSKIDEKELRRAVEKTAAENEEFRSAVVYQGVSVFQQVICERTIPCSVIDLSGSEDADAEVLRICETLVRAPLDLESSPAMEVIYTGDRLLFKVLHVSLGLDSVRKGISGILSELLKTCPEDKSMARWCGLLEEAGQSSAPKAATKRFKASTIKDEIAVYSSHPDKKSVFFVHTGNSGSDAYYQLADKIGNFCSFSVIEPYNLYNPSNPIDGIPAIAEKYIEILQRRQPHGPYILGGWCYGGVVAQEMACQLQARGESVEHLFMFDSHAVTDAQEKKLFTGMTSLTGRDYFETSPLFADLRNQGLLESVIANSRRVSRNLAEHEPSVFKGKVTYFKPQVVPAGVSGESLRYWQEMMTHKAGGYENFCTELEVITTPHEHDLMMDAESLEIIVPEIYLKLK